MPKQKYYYAVVDRETGELLSTDYTLPIYWLKKDALAEASHYLEYIVQPVSAADLHKLILSQPNKKAR